MNRRAFLLAAAASGLTAPAFAGDSPMVQAAVYAAARRGASLLVMQRGEVIFEDYANGGSADHGWELASGTKSFTGVMAAAAIQDGLIRSWDEIAAETLPEWREDERRRITIRHLLSLTSGLAAGPIGRPPTYAAAVATQSDVAPGARFAYGPTPFQVFGEIMRRKLDGDPLQYFTRRILDPLGVRPAQWRRGPDGNPFWPQGAALTARDWARFGWFVLRDGEGRVDRAALAQCFEPSRANPGYGLSWWLLRDGLIPPSRRSEVDIDPALVERYDIRMAAGAGDQRLYLIPSMQMVIARQATFRGILRSPRWSDSAFLRLLLAS